MTAKKVAETFDVAVTTSEACPVMLQSYQIVTWLALLDVQRVH
jgi:hypothetical protein